MLNTVIHGDCLEKLKELADGSVDAVVTDPPYELGFMGKGWDNSGIAYNVSLWQEVLRVLKPGGHLLAFGGTRTYHRMVCAIEDAGFEVRDQCQWLYATGFPKSLNVSKQLDSELGAERTEVVLKVYAGGHVQRNTVLSSGYSGGLDSEGLGERTATLPATDAAKKWQGWGTALKPANEPICVARKPLSESTVAKNVLKHGTGALNIDAGRIAAAAGEVFHTPQSDPKKRAGVVGADLAISKADKDKFQAAQRESIRRTQELGRWPSNVILDEFTAGVLDEMSGVTETKASVRAKRGVDSGGKNAMNSFVRTYGDAVCPHEDSGGASRFFYVAKASGEDRPDYNNHPTVKPLTLMRQLVRLVTPPGGVVLDPFAGSGSTLVACKMENANYIGIEQCEEYVAIARRRISEVPESLFGGEIC